MQDRSIEQRWRDISAFELLRAPRVTTRHTTQYEGQIDYFAVYCFDNGGVYLVPIEDVGTTWMATLRVEPARNGQRTRIMPASDYQVAAIEVPPLSV